MTKEEIHSELGNPETTFMRNSYDNTGETEEYKDFFVCYDEDERCEAIEFFELADIILNGKAIFTGTYDEICGLFDDIEEDNDMTIEQELIALSENKKYGTGRQMLVLSLGCYKTDASIKCLRGLLQAEEVRGHALRALGKCGNSEVLPDIEKYCDSDNRWIRKEALNAADKIRRRENDYGLIRQI